MINRYVPAPYDAILAKFGLAPSAPSPMPATNCSSGVYDVGFEYANSDGTAASHADSVDACCRLCYARGELCNYFSYSADRKQCTMTLTNRGRQPKANVTSGRCRATDPVVPPACDPTGGFCVSYDNGLD